MLLNTFLFIKPLIGEAVQKGKKLLFDIKGKNVLEGSEWDQDTLVKN